MAATCKTCSALLSSDYGEQRCTFCGTLNRHDAPTVGTQKVESLGLGGFYSSWITRTVMALSLIACAAFLIDILHIRPKVEPVPVLPVVPADLKDLGVEVPELSPIDPSGLGNLAALEPIARLPWFQTLAKTWSADARLVTLEIHGARATGSMDVATPGSDPYVRYQFGSRSRELAARQANRAGAKAAWSAIDIVLKRGVLRASVVNSASVGREPTPLVFGCGVPQLIDTWRSRGLPPKDTYSLELSDSVGSKPDPVWESHDATLPRMGIDCRVR
jgi:hypothetical protein